MLHGQAKNFSSKLNSVQDNNKYNNFLLVDSDAAEFTTLGHYLPFPEDKSKSQPRSSISIIEKN